MNRWTPIAAATLVLLGACAQPAGSVGAGGPGSPTGGAPGAAGASATGSPPASSGSGRPSASPPATGRTRPADAVVPTTASALSVQMTVGGLTAVTDKNVYGPVRVTDASRVAQAAGLINAQPVSPLGIHPCPLTAHSGDMTLQFDAGGTTATTVDIPLDGCPGILIEPAHHAPVVLLGGPAQANQVITLLGLDWPHQ